MGYKKFESVVLACAFVCQCVCSLEPWPCTSCMTLKLYVTSCIDTWLKNSWAVLSRIIFPLSNYGHLKKKTKKNKKNKKNTKNFCKCNFPKLIWATFGAWSGFAMASMLVFRFCWTYIVLLLTCYWNIVNTNLGNWTDSGRWIIYLVKKLKKNETWYFWHKLDDMCGSL